HCDGARIFNASVYLKTPVSRLTEKCDSVAFCLSKGLCCPLGSVVVGEKEFAERVRRMRKVLGGGMRQVGYVAATGIVALNTMIDRLEDDHRHAAMIAKAFEGCENGAIKVDLNRVKTNIVFVDTDPEVITSDQMVNLLADSSFSNDEDEIIIKVNTTYLKSRIRLVSHANISEEDVWLAMKKIKNVVEKIGGKDI
ncbi:putative low-specificity L-threonine aldolase 2-like isoform X1, partial [Dinothrombium tinctorium]